MSLATRPARRLRAALAIAGLVAAAALVQPVGPAAGRAETPATSKASAARSVQGQSQSGGTEWTVMMYVDGDNNLDQSLLAQALYATEAQFGTKAKMVALYDRSSDTGATYPMGNLSTFTTAKLMEVQPNQLVELQDMGELDMGSPKTLSWFVSEAAKRYPAEHYSLHIVDHGGAWQGISWDDTAAPPGEPKSHLSLEEVAEGLQDGLGVAGVDKLDVLNLSACLMGSYEVANEMEPYTDYLVAAEEIAYSHFMEMGNIMKQLEGGGVDGATLARSYVDSYDQLSQLYDTGATQSYAALDLSQMANLRQQMDGLQRALREDIGRSPVPLAEARADTLTFGALSMAGVRNSFSQVDIGDLLLRLSSGEEQPSADVLQWSESVRSAIGRVALEQRTGTTTAAATGLSVWFPANVAAGKRQLSIYRDWVPANGWDYVLEDYFDAVQEETAATKLEFAGPMTAEQSAEGWSVKAPLSRRVRAITTSSTFRLHLANSDGSETVLFTQPAVVGPGGRNEVAAGWDRKVIAIQTPNGPLVSTATLIPTTEGFSVQMPVRYTPPGGEEAQGLLLASGDTIDQLEVTGVQINNSSGGTLALKLEPGGTLVPLLLKVGDNGVFYDPAGSPMLMTADGVDLVRTSPAADQQAFMVLTISDATDRYTNTAVRLTT